MAIGVGSQGHRDRAFFFVSLVSRSQLQMALMTVTSGGVPVGNYTGRFGGVEDVLANPEKKFGPGIRWKFTIDDGPYCGQSVSRVTAPAPTFKNSCGKMLAGLVG